MQYRREIDGLRALAVLPVIIYHAGFSFFRGGFVGVDVFFVISGYLITSLIIEELRNDQFSLGAFYERRIRRILPALFVVIVACLPLAWMWLTPTEFTSFSRSLVAAVLSVSNFYFWQTTGYFGRVADEQPLIHTWSLGVEEQFYILFPLCILFIWTRARRYLFHILGLALFASLIAMVVVRQQWPEAAFFLLPTRAWELLVGALCALILLGRQRPASDLLAMAGLALIAMSMIEFSQRTPHPSLYTAAPVLGTALVIVFAGPRTWTARLLSMRVPVGVGLISYSAYLWHQPLFAFARIRSIEAPMPATMLGLAALSLVLAYLTWRYVEVPFRSRRHRVLARRRVVFAGASAFTGLLVAVGVTGALRDGLPGRFTLEPAERDYLATATSSPKWERCLTRDWDFVPPDEACAYFAEDVRVAVLGDSHTVELAYALAKELAPYGIGVKQLSFSACRPVQLERTGSSSSACGAWKSEAVDWIRQNERITHVIVSYRIHRYLGGETAGRYPDVPDHGSDAMRERLATALEDMLAAFATTKEVIFVKQAPELPTHPESLVYKRGQTPDGKLIGVSREWWNARASTFYHHTELKQEKYSVINPTDIFCNSHTCFAGEHGVSYYFDDDHLSVAGAGKVAERIVPLIIGR